MCHCFQGQAGAHQLGKLLAAALMVQDRDAVDLSADDDLTQFMVFSEIDLVRVGESLAVSLREACVDPS